jgi:hypothetical protein
LQQLGGLHWDGMIQHISDDLPALRCCGVKNTMIKVTMQRESMMYDLYIPVESWADADADHNNILLD